MVEYLKEAVPKYQELITHFLLVLQAAENFIVTAKYIAEMDRTEIDDVYLCMLCSQAVLSAQQTSSVPSE